MAREPYVDENKIKEQINYTRGEVERWMRDFEINLRKGMDPDKAWDTALDLKEKETKYDYSYTPQHG